MKKSIVQQHSVILVLNLNPVRYWGRRVLAVGEVGLLYGGFCCITVGVCC